MIVLTVDVKYLKNPVENIFVEEVCSRQREQYARMNVLRVSTGLTTSKVKKIRTSSTVI